MIKFFRTIRRSHLSESRVGKYLGYAMGEILLVVIGILIALQINSWNEIQKRLRLEKEILGEVKIGLEYDYETVTRVIKDHSNFIRSQKIIVDWLEGKYEYNDSLIPHFKYATWTTLFLPKDAQFESLKEFGLRNISNQKLSQQMSNLYDFVYENVLFWQNEYKETSIDFRDTFAELGFEFVKDGNVAPLGMQPTDVEAVKSNKAFLFNLEGTRATLEIYTEYILKPCQKEIEKTIDQIDEELD